MCKALGWVGVSSAGVIREGAAQLQAEKAASAEAIEVTRHDACVLRQPDELPAVEVGSHLEVHVLIEEPEEDGSISKEYGSGLRWLSSRRLMGLPGTRSRRRRARCAR